MNSRREDDEILYIRKAVQYSDRLSEKERGDLRVLFYREYEKDPSKERKAIERLYRFHPDDNFGAEQIIGSYIASEDWAKALPVAERAWQANRAEWNRCHQLALCYANVGLSDQAEKILAQFIESNPDHMFFSSALNFRCNYLMWLRKYEEALADIERLSELYSNSPARYVLKKGLINLCQDDFPAAEREFQKAFEIGDPSVQIDALALKRDLYLMKGMVGKAKEQLSLGLEIVDKQGGNDRTIQGYKRGLHNEMSYLHRISGELPEALKEIEEVLKPPERPPTGYMPLLEALHQKALILLEMKKHEEFEELAEEIRKRIEQEKKPKRMRIYYHLLGQAELKKKNFKKAITLLSKALDLASIPGVWLDGADPDYFFSLAEAYGGGHNAVDLQALRMYEKVTQASVNRLHKGDLYARSYYRIAKYYDDETHRGYAKAYEIKADTSRAVECYRKFLELWKDADPIFSREIADAKERLAALGFKS